MTVTDDAGAPLGVKGPRAASMRERILDAASQAFYADGIRAVSADRVISAVGITKVTFYRYFPTKDDVVVAYLERRSAEERDALAAVVAASADDPAAALTALAAEVARESCQPGFRGCPFINAAVEYSDPEHPVRQVVGRHRRWLRAELERLLRALDVTDPADTADELILLRDGAMTGGYLDDPEITGRALSRAVARILRDQKS